MKKLFLALLSSLLVSTAHAKIDVLFHPKDPTLEQIGQWITEAESSIDIAMYNIDVSDSSPIMQAFKSPSVQNRLQAGTLQARIVFEGYSSKDENARKMQAFEDLGVDARYLGKVVKVHHKFLVIDTGLPNERAATGSANWSMASYRNYNENILYLENEVEASARFQQEFNRLWKNSKEFGRKIAFKEITLPRYNEQLELEVFFNSPRTIDRSTNEPSRLTDQVVRLINNAKGEIQIASTRVRLKPILDALVAASERGVKIQILLSQDDYLNIGSRAKYLLAPKNIEVRVKFYNLRVKDYLAFQMHNKFMIVDNHTLWTGSFNWSESSENKHIENAVEITGTTASQVLPAYRNEFYTLWDLGRSHLSETIQRLTEESDFDCSIIPMSLQVSEIRKLVKLGKACK